MLVIHHSIQHRHRVSSRRLIISWTSRESANTITRLFSVTSLLCIQYLISFINIIFYEEQAMQAQFFWGSLPLLKWSCYGFVALLGCTGPTTFVIMVVADVLAPNGLQVISNHHMLTLLVLLNKTMAHYLRNIHIALQISNKQYWRKVVGSATRLTRCFRRVDVLTVTTHHEIHCQVSRDGVQV